MAVEIRVLGRVDAVVDGHSLTLKGRKQRAVLAMLALRANRTVAADELIDGLWGDHPPQSATTNVQYYVSQLRKALASDDSGASIVTHGRGYELQLPQDAVDAVRFEHLVERARREGEQRNPDGAARGALELWRGAPLADVAEEPFAGPEIRRLEELHLRALELAIDAELAAGRHVEVTAELEALIPQEPLRERFHAQRMLALYRDGRQSEALDAYREARQALIDQIGVEPGPELQKLQAAILAQDPSLDAPPPTEELPAQLEGGSPLIAGRERELGWLRSRWEEARGGRVVVALVVGPTGIGKTRLVAELAREVQGGSGLVLCTGGGEVAEAGLATIARAERSTRPTLLVLDYADDAPPAVLGAAAALAREPADRSLLICVVHHDEQGPPPFAALLEAGAGQRLRLDRLPDEAVAEIAELYAPAEGAPMPLETLVAASEGVPLRVHRTAGEWARAQAAERLEATMGTAAIERGGARAAEAEVADGVADLQRARERTHRYVVEQPIDPAAPVVCPFRGLAPFDAAHAEYFFGRERLTAELVARLVGSTLLAVVGPSGSGKSSAMRAGLLPALASGVVPGSEDWRQAVMRPGERPVAELSRTLARTVPDTGAGGKRAPTIATALDRLAPGERLVLVIDQFEEVFVACRDADEREAFLDALVEGAGDPEERLVVLIALRADFYADCARHAPLASLIASNQVLVGPMRRDELRRAIELPARRTGLRVESQLVSVLVGDVADEPGGLPLLSAALVELWQRRSDRSLRYSDYERSGGVRGAVARLAEGAYGRLSEAERRRARLMLLRLAGDEEEGGAPVRRRVALDELEVDRDDHAAGALAVLTESRLVTVDEGTVEVAHEALLSQWPRLRGWLEEDAEGRRLHQHLIHAAAEWQASGRDPAELYRGSRLASALEWAEGHEREPNELEQTFLAESRSASEREAERQRRTNRRLRTLLAGVGVLLAAAAVAGVIALSERQGARDAATVADARRLAAQALSEERLDQALRLATAGVALDDSVATRSSLLSTLLRSPEAIGVLRTDGEEALLALALSPDAETLAVSDEDGTVTLFDTETHEVVGDHQAPGAAYYIAFDPQGDSLAIAEDTSATGTLEILDAATGRVRSSTSLAARRGFANLGIVTYAPDGRSLFVPYTRDEPGGGNRYSFFLRRYDARRGTPLGKPVRVAPSVPLVPPVMSPDGRLLVSTERGVKAIDAETLRVIRRYPVGAATAVSPDGRTLAIEAADGGLRLLDLASGRVRTLSSKMPQALAFSPDGRTLSTAEDDGSVILWDVEEGVTTETLEGHAGLAETHAFSPDGRTLYTAGNDGRVIVWDVAGDRRLGRRFPRGLGGWEGGHEDYPPAFALSPDGRALAFARLDGRVELIDAETLRRTASFEAFPGRSAAAIDYSADGRRLAVAGEGGGLGVWDAESGEQVGALLRAPRGPRAVNRRTVQGLAFGQGDLLAAAEVGGAVRIWDVGRRELLRPLRLPPSVHGLAFSPDGSQLAIPFGAFPEEGPNGVEILDVASGARIARLSPDSEIRSVAFSPDGSLLAGGTVDGGALLWATDDWRQVGRPLARRNASTLYVEFSPDGRTLATSHSDHSVALWDVASQEPIGPLLPDPAVTDEDEISVTARFTPDGARLFVLSNPADPGEGRASNLGRGIRWEVDPELWLQRACALAGGGLTPQQWAELVPEQDYVSACPSD